MRTQLAGSVQVDWLRETTYNRGAPDAGTMDQAALTASLNAFPAVNFTVFAAGMLIVSPVDGLRPLRSARAPVENDPKPTSCTVSPRVTAPVTAARMASMVSPVLALLSPCAGRDHINEFLFIHA